MLAVTASSSINPSLFQAREIVYATTIESTEQHAIHKALGTLQNASGRAIHILPMEGGRSGDPLYRIDAGSRVYVLRIVSGGFETFKTFSQLASDHGFGPKLLYADKETSTLLMEFVQGVPLFPEHLEDLKLVEKFADHLKMIHQSPAQLLPSDPYKKIFARAASCAHPDLNLDLIIKKVEAIKTLFAKCNFPQSCCHNDLHSGNLFYDANGSIKVIDWGDCGSGDPFFDLARVSIELSFSKEQNALFLHRYFGRDLETHEWAHFYLMQQIALVRSGFSLLHHGETLDQLVVQRLVSFSNKGILTVPPEVNLEGPIHSKEMARWIFDTFLENTGSETFLNAVVTLSERAKP